MSGRQLTGLDIYLLAEQRRREWARLDDVGRVRLWLGEIKVAIPSLTLEAVHVLGPGLPDAAVEVTWRWRDEHRRDGSLVPGKTYVARLALEPSLLEDRDRHFGIFARRVGRLIERVLHDAREQLTTIHHETLDEYVERGGK